MLVSTEDSARSEVHQAGMEVISPLVFLDTCQLGSSENLTTLDEFLPIIGEDYFLPKEQSEDYIELPILQELGRFYSADTLDILTNIILLLIIEDRETGAVASWDSSAHENSKLNRLTPEHERLYMIVKVTLRLSDPSACGNTSLYFF